jgi:hypothetical protein
VEEQDRAKLIGRLESYDWPAIAAALEKGADGDSSFRIRLDYSLLTDDELLLLVDLLEKSHGR